MHRHLLLATLIVVNVASITHHAFAQTKRPTPPRVVIPYHVIDRVDVPTTSNACNDRAFEIVTRRNNEPKCVSQ
jgi:hypothetical protein